MRARNNDFGFLAATHTFQGVARVRLQVWVATNLVYLSKLCLNLLKTVFLREKPAKRSWKPRFR
jgi:hypothetical protein